MSQKLTLKAKGLYTEPNQLSELPEGSMLVAENVVIDRSNVVESRRGFAQYGNTFGLPDQRAKQLLVYKNRILIHNDDNLYFNANPHNNTQDGNFQKFAGSYLETETGLRIRAFESNKNLYFTSSDGIKKISAKTADDFTTAVGFIRDAGAAKALDVTGDLNNTVEGFLPPNSKVAYRIVWSYKDANSNLLAGSPSSRLVISNYNNTNANVNLEFAIPQAVTTDYFYQVYRSAVFTAVGNLSLGDIDPGDELQLVIEDFPTSAELAAGVVDVTDLAPEDFRTGGLPLYTNPSSGDGIQAANEPPPKAKDITMYQNTLFYANTETRAGTTVTLLSVEDLISGTSSVTIDDTINTPQTYTFIGEKEKSKFDFTSYSSTIPLLNGKYFLLNSASDKRKYYVWYDNTKTKQIIDFAQYVGVVPTDLDGTFFVLFTPDSNRTYYVWYDATGGSVDPGTDPTNGLVGFDGIRVNIATGVSNVVQLANITSTTIATNDIDDDFDVNYRAGGAAGVTVTAGNPTQFTSAAHGLQTGDRITVSASTTTPSINGKWYVTVTGANTFTIPVTTTVGGTATWACDSAAVIVYSKSFDTSSIVQLETLGKGFSLTNLSDDSADPALNPGNTDVIGKAPIRVNTSRNVTTLALVADETASSLVEQDGAEDFNVTYTSGSKFIEVENNNNGVTTDATDSSIHPIGNGFAVTIEHQGQGEDAPLKHILLSSAPTPAQQIDETARSLVNVINKNPNSSVYAFYLSGPTDLPGQILLQTKDIGVNQFNVTADSALTGAEFNPSLPPVPNAQPVSGIAEIKPNRIYFAKLQQPEAVPLLNFLDVGPADKAISRILALRESLFILKEDGVYRLTGTNGNYSVNLFDESTKIIAPDSAVVLNNQIYCLTNLGIVTITDTGVSIISQPIKSDIQLLTSSAYNFKHTTFGVSYENDRSYLLWMPSTVTDTVATIAYRHNTITQTFTTFDISKTCGLVNPGDDKLYLGPSDVNFIERERKLFNRTDFADRNFDLVIPSNSVNGTLLRLSSSVKIDIGDAVVQTQYMTIGEYNQLLKKLDLDPAIGQAETTRFDFTSLTGSIPSSLHSKYFTLFSASDARRYAVFFDAIGDLPTLDTNVFNDLTGAIQIRVDISSGVTTLADLALATKTAIQSSSFDFLVSYFTGDMFFQTTTVRNGNTSDATDGPGNAIGNGFAITVLQQGLGDYFSSLEMLQGANIYSALSALATKLDSDPGINQNDFLAAIGSPITFPQAQTAFNIIVTKLNNDTSVTYQNYPLSAGTKDFEVLILSKALNTTDINMQFSMPYVEGAITVYKGISCNVQYAAETFGDTSMLKQVTEATVIFQDANFSRATAGFRTDLSPGYENIDFTKSGKGDFGFFVFSQHNWGGGFSGVPLRTYIPRQKQRCRYMQMNFLHDSSREHFALFGFSYTYRGISERAYRS